MLPLWDRADQEVRAMKGYSAFLKTSALLEPCHQIVNRYIQNTHLAEDGVLIPLQRCSWCILLGWGQNELHEENLDDLEHLSWRY